MRFDIKLGEYNPDNPVRAGNVYPVKGGYGVRGKHMMVLLSFTPDGNNCLLIVLNKDGQPIGVTQYGTHHMAERMPIGFVPGIEDLTFDVMPL